MKIAQKLIGLLLILFFVFPIFAAGKSSTKTVKMTTTLSAAEESTLLWMREEEKVARDVYLNLYKIWNKAVFAKIAKSEQAHMNAVLKKIQLFDLTDPALPEVGSFSNPELQALYDQLMAQGEISYIEALRVGATIEDMDILDIGNAIAETDNLALKTTYEHLLEGSKNHLRAFVRLLDKAGVEYSPQFIDQALFDSIIGV